MALCQRKTLCQASLCSMTVSRGCGDLLCNTVKMTRISISNHFHVFYKHEDKIFTVLNPILEILCSEIYFSFNTQEPMRM